MEVCDESLQRGLGVFYTGISFLLTAGKGVSLGEIHVYGYLVHEQHTKRVFKGGSGRQLMLGYDSSLPLFLLNQFLHDAWLVRSASELQ